MAWRRRLVARVGTELGMGEVACAGSVMPERKLTVRGELPETEAGVGVVPKTLAQVAAADRDGDGLGRGLNAEGEQSKEKSDQESKAEPRRLWQSEDGHVVPTF